MKNLDTKRYVESIQTLCSEIENRFGDFRNHEIEFKLFSEPFDIEPEKAPEHLQMELIDLQADTDLKRAYNSNDLVEFYKLYLGENYQHLKTHAQKLISLFGSTYTCEQFFSRMKFVKNKYRTRLTDQHLTCQLRIATSSMKADIDQLCKGKQFHKSH